MDKQTIRRVVIALIAVSAAIYILQIAIFHDESTTAFYLLQDLAFMPVTIAIATLVVGEIINEREKKERLEKTRMLTSSFFTGIGAYLLKEILRMTDKDAFLTEVVRSGAYQSGTEKEILGRIQNAKLNVHLDGEGYTKTRQLIRENQTFFAKNSHLVDSQESRQSSPENHPYLMIIWYHKPLYEEASGVCEAANLQPNSNRPAPEGGLHHR